MYAIVETGGKQLKVAVGDIVNVEKLDCASAIYRRASRMWREPRLSPRWSVR